jgi:hypothetical protein
MTHLVSLLVTAAALLTLYATASFLTGFDADFKTSALLAILCLGSVIALEHREHERRRRMTEYRAGVWDRRDRQAR